MFYSKLTSIFSPIIIFFFLELILIWPKTFWTFFVLMLVILPFSMFIILKKGERKFSYFILPFLFFIGATVYSTLLVNNLLAHLIYLSIAVFLYLYFKNIFLLTYKPQNARNDFLENFSSFGNFLVMFFVFSSIFGMQSFLNAPVWLMILILLPIIFLVILEVFWANKLIFKKNAIFILVISIILIEMAWAASFLPFNYNSLGLSLAIIYYILIGISRFNLKGGDEKGKIKLYLIFGLVSVILILLTSNLKNI